MPPSVAPARRLFFAVCLLPVATAATVAAARGPTEQDQFEEKMVNRGVERAVRVLRSDRGAWVKELGEQFPDKVGNPLKEEEYGAWFKLLAGDAAEWRRDDAPNTQIAALYDRVIQKLELGPVPSVKREEFMRYARKHLVSGNPQHGEGDANEEADKVFRALDRNSDGVLDPEEMTTKLREERPTADKDGNGRIDKDEYRAYFRQRVAASAEAATKAGDQPQKFSADGRTVARPGVGISALPAWFTDLDADKDGQISLAEWRKAGRSISTFMEMDLDGDGLLTKEEYLRYARVKEKEAAAAPPEKKSGKM